MLPAIHVEGVNFVDETGKRFPYVGVSDFALFKRWLMHDGPAALVAPRLAEWRALAEAGGYRGPIVLRVFRYSHPNNKFGIGDPWSYDFAEITKFTQFCGERGFYVDWTCGDSQHILPEKDGPRGQQEHLNRTCAALVGCTNAFVETSNESMKNGQLAEHGVVPSAWGSYLRDSGAYGEKGDWPVGTNLDFVSYHGTRSRGGLAPWPKWLIDVFAQAAVLSTEHGKPAVLKEPVGADEPDYPGRRPDRESNPDLFARLGLVIAFCAGVTFHSQDGRDGDALKPTQRQCAIAFFRGIAAGLAV